MGGQLRADFLPAPLLGGIYTEHLSDDVFEWSASLDKAGAGTISTVLSACSISHEFELIGNKGP